MCTHVHTHTHPHTHVKIVDFLASLVMKKEKKIIIAINDGILLLPIIIKVYYIYL